MNRLKHRENALRIGVALVCDTGELKLRSVRLALYSFSIWCRMIRIHSLSSVVCIEY